MRSTRTWGGELSNWQLGGVTTEAKFHMMVRETDLKWKREITETILPTPNFVKRLLENLTK